MGSYDSPGFVSPIPGDPGFTHDSAFRAPGTAPQQPPEASGESTVVTAPGGRPEDTESVDPYDVIMPAQESTYRPDIGRESISGVGGVGSTGAGAGHVWQPRGGARP